MRVVTYRYHDTRDQGSSSTEFPWPPSIGGPDSRCLPTTEIQGYEDWAIATDPSYRPQLAQLLADNQQRPADYLWISQLADLGDCPAAVQRCLEALAQGGTQVQLCSGDGRILPQTLSLAEGIAVATAMQDQHQRQQRRAGHARNRTAALPPPGKAPYGYRRGQGRYLIDRSAAPVITALVNEFLLYGSLRGAVRFVEKRFGKRIAVSTGRRWLTHPVYRGDLQYQDGQVLRDTHAAIISREEAAQIDRLLRRNRSLPPRTAAAPRSLAGLVRCHTCGGGMSVSTTTVRGKAEGYVYLRPTTCPHHPRCAALPYNTVLQAVIAEICRTLPQAVEQWQSRRPTPSPLAHLQAQLRQRQAALDQLPALVETGVLDAETAALRRYTLCGEIAHLEAQRAQLPPVNLSELASSVALPQFWLDLSESERRFFFREFLRHIDILRQNKAWHVALVLVF